MDEVKIAIKTQMQHWDGFARAVIIAIDSRGSILGTVQTELYAEKQPFRSTAYIYALFVEKDSRGRGLGAMLMREAEAVAASKGHKSIALQWAFAESPQWVCDWYARLGYETEDFPLRRIALMIKKL